MKALVTGATGFIGGNLVRELLKDGHEVRALCRPEADMSTLKDLDVEVAIGDLRDRGSLAGAMKGREALFHTAALYSLWSPDPGDFVKTNVDGTVNILEAAMEAEVSRVVYTSTASVFGHWKGGPIPNESSSSSLDEIVDGYHRSKFHG